MAIRILITSCFLVVMGFAAVFASLMDRIRDCFMMWDVRIYIHAATPWLLALSAVTSITVHTLTIVDIIEILVIEAVGSIMGVCIELIKQYDFTSGVEELVLMGLF